MSKRIRFYITVAEITACRRYGNTVLIYISGGLTTARQTCWCGQPRNSAKRYVKSNSLLFYRSIVSRPGATGAHSGPCPPQMTVCAPPNKNCAPSPSEDCALKKLTGSGLLECKSRPDTPKLVFTARIFVILWTHTGFHKNFGMKTFIFWSSRKNSWTIARVLRR